MTDDQADDVTESVEEQLAAIHHRCGHLVAHDMSKWPRETPRSNMCVWFAMHLCPDCRNNGSGRARKAVLEDDSRESKSTQEPSDA